MTCYKCGKELGEDAVSPECDPPCNGERDVTVSYQSKEGKILSVTFQCELNPAALDTPEKMAAFRAAIEKHANGVERVFENSGLVNFLKKS